MTKEQKKALWEKRKHAPYLQDKFGRTYHTRSYRPGAYKNTMRSPHGVRVGRLLASLESIARGQCAHQAANPTDPDCHHDDEYLYHGEMCPACEAGRALDQWSGKYRIPTKQTPLHPVMQKGKT